MKRKHHFKMNLLQNFGMPSKNEGKLFFVEETRKISYEKGYIPKDIVI